MSCKFSPLVSVFFIASPSAHTHTHTDTHTHTHTRTFVYRYTFQYYFHHNVSSLGCVLVQNKQSLYHVNVDNIIIISGQYCVTRDIFLKLIEFMELFPLYVLKFNLVKPTGYVMHHQFNIQQLYALPTLYLCVLYLSENKQRLVPLTA